MKKIRLRNDLKISGYGMILKGTEYKVEKYNTRYVYIRVESGALLRLARRGDCEVVY
ncbi:MAG: hypothetical protein IKP50_00415 [Bacilli bacterium]|nr:hypothetical protein [Bacilli bacterium]